MRGHDRSGVGRSRGWCRSSGHGLAQRGLPPVILGRACQGASEDIALVTQDVWSDALRFARSAYALTWGRLSVRGDAATGLTRGENPGSPGAVVVVVWCTWLRAGRRDRAVCPAGAVDARGAPAGETRGRGLLAALERGGERAFSMIRNFEYGERLDCQDRPEKSPFEGVSTGCRNLITWECYESVGLACAFLPYHTP